jgi:hypothetical protein
MKRQTLNPFPHTPHDSVNRGSRRTRCFHLPARVLAAMLTIGLPLMQIAPAIAGEQVLELPQVIANPANPPSSPNSYRSVPDLYDTAPGYDANGTVGTSREATSAPDPAPPPTAVAANSEAYPPDPNVGSIDDYQNQPGENGQRPSIALGRGGSRPEPATSMTANLILGGILVGMIALEVASAHHRHR